MGQKESDHIILKHNLLSPYGIQMISSYLQEIHKISYRGFGEVYVIPICRGRESVFKLGVDDKTKMFKI